MKSSELPEPIIKEYDGIFVVRDDLLDGGTKRRLFNRYIQSMSNVDEFVYYSPREGYGQLALSYSCRDLGKKSVVFVPKGKRTELTNISESLGSTIYEVPMGYLTNLYHKSKKYCDETGSHLIPFGGDDEIMINEMCNVASSLDVKPTQVWSVMSSGVINRGLQKCFSNVDVFGVMVGHNPTEKEIGRAVTFRSKYKFQQKCKKSELPPFPSSLTYDSKGWSYVLEKGKKGSLFWNVGGDIK